MVLYIIHYQMIQYKFVGTNYLLLHLIYLTLPILVESLHKSKYATAYCDNVITMFTMYKKVYNLIYVVDL